MSKACLFCGATGAGTLTNEHVNPAWLLEYLKLPDDDMLFQGVASSETGTLTQPPRVHSSFNFLQGHVCGDCNTGWMSRLESASKPLIISMIDETRTIESLSPAEAAVVGKWAVKTAYMHSCTAPIKRPVQPEHLHALLGDEGVPVPGVHVFGMQAEYKQPSAYLQTWFWPHLGHFVGEPKTPDGAYKLGLQFRGLYFAVAFWPEPIPMARLGNLHVPVFPSGLLPMPEYSLDLKTGDGPIDRLAHFCNWLALWHA